MLGCVTPHTNLLLLLLLLLQVLPLLHVELDKGDTLFFHCNVLHRSEQNHSARRRWAFLSSYNRASNNPVTPHHHPQYTPLIKVLMEYCTFASFS